MNKHSLGVVAIKIFTIFALRESAFFIYSVNIAINL